MTHCRPSVALLTLLVVSTGCQVPRFEGPQVQEPPPGFILQPDTYAQRRAFPDLDVTEHSAWVHTDYGGVSLIYVDEHPVALTMDHVLEARQAAAQAARDPDTNVGQVEKLTIDGRDAWGWYTYVGSETRGLEDVSYTAVVPYEDATYAIEFTSSQPRWKRGAPDELRGVVSSFAVGRTTYNLPLIAIVLGVALLGVGYVRGRRKDRADRLRSINLVQVKKDEDDEGSGDAERRSTDPAAVGAAQPAGVSASSPRPAAPNPPSGE